MKHKLISKNNIAMKEYLRAINKQPFPEHVNYNKKTEKLTEIGIMNFYDSEFLNFKTETNSFNCIDANGKKKKSLNIKGFNDDVPMTIYAIYDKKYPNTILSIHIVRGKKGYC